MYSIRTHAVSNGRRMHLKLTNGQGVFLFGWSAPQTLLRWSDVVSDKGNTPRRRTFQLLLACGLSEQSLKELQPSVQEWIDHGNVSIEDARNMVLWPLHPIRDLHCDMATILLMKFSASELLSMGVTYEDLSTVGMTAVHMKLFGFSLSQWVRLGLRRSHVEMLDETRLTHVFGMPKTMILMSVPS